MLQYVKCSASPSKQLLVGLECVNQGELELVCMKAGSTLSHLHALGVVDATRQVIPAAPAHQSLKEWLMSRSASCSSSLLGMHPGLAKTVHISMLCNSLDTFSDVLSIAGLGLTFATHACVSSKAHL